MSIGQEAGASVGSVTVVTTMDGGHPAEFFAQRIVERLIQIADTAPEPIRAQAMEYRERMYAVVLDGVKRAIASDRAYFLTGKER
jgi:hypothetical protein